MVLKVSLVINHVNSRRRRYLRWRNEYQKQDFFSVFSRFVIEGDGAQSLTHIINNRKLKKKFAPNIHSAIFNFSAVLDNVISNK
jgi:hypothetical protein